MTKKERTYRIMISGGGTGGHIYPAISIAQALEEALQHVEILFVGAKGKMEMKKVPEAGYQIESLWISGIPRKISPNHLMLPIKLCSSLMTASRLLKKFNPDVVVGVGGYASGPLLYMAGMKNIPTLIQEQNSYAGLTNKWLARTASVICVAHEGMERYFPKEKLVVTGNPVRHTIKLSPDRIEEAWKHFDLNPDKPTFLVLGGSLGARTLNESILKGMEKLLKNDVQLVWQVGSSYYDEMVERANKLPTSIVIRDFVRQMNYAYAIADVVISRAGALSVAELMLTGKPTILVPSPNVAEDHQSRNAEALVRRHAAKMVKDEEATDSLLDEALALINNKVEKAKLSKNIRAMAHENASKEIANEIIKLIV